MTTPRQDLCPACGGAKTAPRPSRRAPEDFGLDSFSGYSMHRCAECRTEFGLPRKAMSYAKSDRFQIYQRFLSRDELAGRIHHTRRATSHFKDAPMVFRILEQLADRGVLLDFAAGSGYMTALAAELGFEPHAIEISEKLRSFVSESVAGVAVFSSIEEFRQTGKSADVVVAMHILEHVESPLDLAGDLRSALSPDGLLIVVVPNLERSYYRFGEIGFEMQEQVESDGLTDFPPNHLTRFSGDGMKRLLERAGFASVAHRFSPVGAWDLFHHGLGDPAFEFRSYFADPERSFVVGQIEIALNEALRRLGHENLGHSLITLASDRHSTEELDTLLEIARSKLFEVYDNSNREAIDQIRKQQALSAEQAATNLSEGNSYIESLRYQVARTESHARASAESANRILAAKDAYIESLQAALATKDAELSQVQASGILAAKDAYIESLREALAIKETEIAALRKGTLSN